MARIRKSATLDSPEARTALRARQEPYWHRIEQGLFLGYRKSKAGGRWIVRRYRVSAAPGTSRYFEKALGVADDHCKADGADVLTFGQAQRKILTDAEEQALEASGQRYTVREAVADYVDWLHRTRKSADATEVMLNAYVLSSSIADKRLADLKPADFEAWLTWAMKRRRKRRGKAAEAADKVALSPVNEHVRKMHATYETNIAAWERAREARKLDRTNARKAAGSGDEYAVALQEIADEPKPRKPWLVCSEPTAEGLVKSLADGQYAQGIYTDEGGQFLGGHALTEEAELRTIAMLSRLWQGDRIDRVRATDSEHVILYGRRISMHLLVQPDVATRMLGKPLYRSQGFLARWLMAAPESLAGTRLHDLARPEPADDPRIRRFWHVIGKLLAAPANENREVGGLDPPCVALTPEARGLLVAAYDEIERAQGHEGTLEGVREWASKAAEHACRIAGVLTLTADPSAHAVTGETMAGALALTQFYLSEYVRLIGSADVPEHIRHAHELLGWLRQKGRTTITARDVMRLGPGRAIRHGDAAKAALRTLAEHGWLTTEDGKLYTVSPATFSEDAP